MSDMIVILMIVIVVGALIAFFGSLGLGILVVFSNGNGRAWVEIILDLLVSFLRRGFFHICELGARIWKNYKQNNNDLNCQIIFDWTEPCKVGEQVKFRVSPIKKKYQPQDSTGTQLEREPSLNESECQQLLDSIVVEIRQALSYQLTNNHIKIEYVKEVDPVAEEVVVKFLVRTAGQYLIIVSYEGVRLPGCPFRKRFQPTYIDGSKTVFLRPSSTLVCLAGAETSFEIQPKDKYGNEISYPVLHKNNKDTNFEFIPKHADEILGHVPISADIGSHVFIAKPGNVRQEFVMLFREPGIFKGQITYDGKPIVNGIFDVLCITQKENSEMHNIANNNPAWTYHSAVTLAIGDQVQTKLRKSYLYISPKLFYVQEYVLKIFPIRLAVYRVSPMTKITMNSRDGHYTFAVCDGIQPKITLQMEESKARILLALFCHFLRKRLGGSENFEGKQRMFYQELRGTMRDIRMTSNQITVNRSNLIYSTMKVTKFFKKSDWCKNFGIKFECENGYDYGGLRREWLELLCVKFFQNDAFGMFSSIGTSRLVHPNDSTSRYPIWHLKHYELGGKIIGKCLFESACGENYSQMVNAKFSRSFLAQVLGLPPNYQHFETDDPELYLSKVKYILANDVSDMELTFSEEEYKKGKLIRSVELIVNGSKKSVNSENKEQYLNALAQYRLGTKAEKEIEAFKKGLYEIVPEELLSNFDENELELLMCGRSEFDVEDLKQHCIKGTWTWSKTYNKIFNWFCTSVSNMSDSERSRLLQFVTGSSLLPLEGFKSLSPKFKVSISNDYGKLPTAHTCFNEICLCDHDSFENFDRAIRTAISEGAEGFAFT